MESLDEIQRIMRQPPQGETACLGKPLRKEQLPTRETPVPLTTAQNVTISAMFPKPARKRLSRKGWNAMVVRLANDRAHGRCEECGQLPDWRGLSGDHKLSRAQGRDDSEDNCIIKCGRCHSLRHGVVER